MFIVGRCFCGNRGCIGDIWDTTPDDFPIFGEKSKTRTGNYDREPRYEKKFQ